jgi:uncharacterized protein (DUF1499 family)
LRFYEEHFRSDHRSARSSLLYDAYPHPTLPSDSYYTSVHEKVNPDTQRLPFVFLHTTRKIKPNLSILSKISLLYLIVHQCFAITVIACASLWDHTYGIIAGIVCLVLGVIYSIIWYRQIFLMSSSYQHFVQFTVRPCYFLLRCFTLTLLLALFFVHVLYPDPSWAQYPTQCDGSPPYVNCARLGDNPVNSSPLQPPHITSSLSSARAADLEYLKSLPLTTVLDSVQYPANVSGNPQPAVLIRSRILSEKLGFPDDFLIQIFCDDNYNAVFWAQSQSRANMKDLGVSTRRLDDLLQYLSTATLSGVCISQ